MKWFNARTYIAFGLAVLVVSLLLAAAFMGLVPDRVAALRDGRSALSETIAATGTVLATRGEPRLLESTLRLVVQRNPDVLSMALRNAEGKVLVVDISNAPFSRPGLATLLSGLKFIRQKEYPIRGILA